MAAKLGIEKAAMIRLRAGLSFGLAEATSDGHCGLPVADLLKSTAALIEVRPELIAAALDLELRDGDLIADTVAGAPCVFLAGLYRSEQVIAERLRRLSSGRPAWPIIDLDRAIPWVESRTMVTLAPSQREALRLAVAAKVLVITGGPGVGKTTLVNSILKVLQAKGVEVALCAPTGRAAKRLTESTGLDVRTIHRLLEADPSNGGFKRAEEHPLSCDLLVVDEASMVDVPLMRALLRALPDQAALLARGRCRPAAERGSWAGAGGHHRLRRCAGDPADGGVPAGGDEPDHHQRAPHQPGTDAGADGAGGLGLLLR